MTATAIAPTVEYHDIEPGFLHYELTVHLATDMLNTDTTRVYTAREATRVAKWLTDNGNTVTVRYVYAEKGTRK